MCRKLIVFAIATFVFSVGLWPKGAYFPFPGKLIAAPVVMDITLLSDNEFYYRTPEVPVNHLKAGEIIATPYHPPAGITSAEVVSGTLPAGISLYPNGFIVVENADLINAGKYPLEIETTDEQKQKVVTPLLLQFAKAGDWSDREAVYRMGQTKQINELTEGDVRALPVDKNRPIKAAKCIMGNLPSGTELTVDGKIVVVDRQILVPDIYNTGIVTVDGKGGVTFFMVTVPLEPEKDVKY